MPPTVWDFAAIIEKIVAPLQAMCFKNGLDLSKVPAFQYSPERGDSMPGLLSFPVHLLGVAFRNTQIFQIDLTRADTQILVVVWHRYDGDVHKLENMAHWDYIANVVLPWVEDQIQEHGREVERVRLARIKERSDQARAWTQEREWIAANEPELLSPLSREVKAFVAAAPVSDLEEDWALLRGRTEPEES